MTEDQLKQLNEINQRIWNCRKCEFHRILESKSKHYRPDAPIIFNNKARDKAVIVGINPGWMTADEKHWESIYALDDFDDYTHALEVAAEERHKVNKRNPYRDKIANDFNEINKRLIIYDDNEIRDEDKYNNSIKSESIYDYVFWANLSFCNSQSPTHRKFFGEELPCRVFSEEIPNCIERGFLKRIFTIIDPEIIIFFTSSAIGYVYYKLLLGKLFDIDPYQDIIAPKEKDTMYRSQKRSNNTEIQIQMIPCKIKDKKTNVLFLAHPGYHFNSEFKIEAFDDLCNKLKKLQ